MKKFLKLKGANGKKPKSESPKRIHVIPRRKEWVVKKQGSEKALRVLPAKKEAITLSEKYRNEGFDVIIHKKNGTVKEWKNARK